MAFIHFCRKKECTFQLLCNTRVVPFPFQFFLTRFSGRMYSYYFIFALEKMKCYRVDFIRVSQNATADGKNVFFPGTKLKKLPGRDFAENFPFLNEIVFWKEKCKEFHIIETGNLNTNWMIQLKRSQAKRAIFFCWKIIPRCARRRLSLKVFILSLDQISLSLEWETFPDIRCWEVSKKFYFRLCGKHFLIQKNQEKLIGNLVPGFPHFFHLRLCFIV